MLGLYGPQLDNDNDGGGISYGLISTTGGYDVVLGFVVVLWLYHELLLLLLMCENILPCSFNFLGSSSH